MATPKVQQVNKASSDELLRKFANNDDEDNGTSKKKEIRSRKRQKRCRKVRNEDSCESPSNNNTSNTCLVERKSLLPLATRRTALFRQLGMGRSQFIRNRALFIAIEKTWRKTMEGASRVFIEKHYNRHKRLKNEIV